MSELARYVPWAAGVGAALWGLHRLGLWLDDRGWLFYRRSSRRGRWGRALAAAFDPQVRRILEIQERIQRQDDEDGDPLRPRVRVDGVAPPDEGHAE
jgi:hypothetical protein